MIDIKNVGIYYSLTSIIFFFHVSNVKIFLDHANNLHTNTC